MEKNKFIKLITAISILFIILFTLTGCENNKLTDLNLINDSVANNNVNKEEKLFTFNPHVYSAKLNEFMRKRIF